MALALFDLDYTILNGDTERLWAVRQIELGLWGEDVLLRLNEYDEDYAAGRLDLREYMRYYFTPHQTHPRALMEQERDRFLEEEVRPRLRLARRVQWHRERQDELVLITASSAFTGHAVARMLDFSYSLATEIEVGPEGFTGEIVGTPCFRENKLVCLQHLLEEQNWSLEESWGYSDSLNDLPLLEAVTHPVLVTPDPSLEAIGKERGWEVLQDLR